MPTAEEEFAALAAAEAARGPAPRKSGALGTVVAVACVGATVGMVALAWPFLSPALRKHCLPYVPATTAQVENVVRACKGVPAMKRVADLGSGDGRIVIALAQSGYKAAGFELNPWLVWYSRWSAYRAGVSHLTSFHTMNLWKADFSQYDGVVIFGVAEMMNDLRGKLLKELAPAARIVACRFPMAGVVLADRVGTAIDTVWVYEPRLPDPADPAAPVPASPSTESSPGAPE